MKYRDQQFTLPGRSTGPLGRVAAVVAAAVVIASALVLGFVVFLVVIGVMLFAWAGLMVRSWIRAAGAGSSGHERDSGTNKGSETLEGEFQVLDKGAGKPPRGEGKR